MIEIKNLKTTKPTLAYDVIVDRTTILGNPYIIKSNYGINRDVVCDKYNGYFYKNLHYNNLFKKELDRIYNIYYTYKKLRLFCWCSPERCHAETIKKYLINRK